MLVGPAEDASAVGEDHRIEILSALVPHGSDQHRRARLGGRIDEALGGLHRTPYEFGLQHQVLGRIADHLQLGADEEIGVLRLAAHFQHRRGIALEVADALVHLGNSDAQSVDHGPHYRSG